MESVVAGSAGIRLVLESPACDSSIDARFGRVQREVPKTISNRPATRVAWDDSIELVGWEVPARVRRGEPFQIDVVYKVLKPLDRSWSVFVHLDGPKMRANGDHDPLGGRCPTSTWKPGDVIVDRTSLRVNPSYDTGSYALWIGFFGGSAPSWRNLPVSEAPASLRDDVQRYKLTTVEVGE